MSSFPALLNLWNGESGWRWNAQNPASPAYGIPQADPGNKMAAAGSDWVTDAATQMRWGFAYIRSVYGSPDTAWNLWQGRSPHWYAMGGKVMDKGGWLAPGWNPPMYNGTGSAEPVGAAAGGGAMTIQLEITGASTGDTTFDAFLTKWLKNHVRVKGGGSVQKAFGRAPGH
jgi:hypothetical protein